MLAPSRADTALPNRLVAEDGDTERQDLLIDDKPDPETVLGDNEDRKLGNMLLREALASLTERERHIIEERRLVDNPRTLEEIGAEYGISRERVRQIENRAFAKLQKADIQVVQCTLTCVAEKHDGSDKNDPKMEAFAQTQREVARAMKVPVNGSGGNAGLRANNPLGRHASTPSSNRKANRLR